MLFIYLCNWYTRSIKLEWEPYNGLAFHQGVGCCTNCTPYVL